MSTKKTTTPSAKKTFVKEIKDSIDFSSLYTNYNHEKGLSSENFLSLIRKSSSAKNEEISKYISSNETIKELFSNSQLLTEIIYGRAEKYCPVHWDQIRNFRFPCAKLHSIVALRLLKLTFKP